MLDSLPYDILELIVFRLCLLTAGDIGALKQVNKFLREILSARYDVVRHHALGGLRHCLDIGSAPAALYALKYCGADPTTDKGRALRVAIRTRHVPLFKWLVSGGFTRSHDTYFFYIDLMYTIAAGNRWAYYQLMQVADLASQRAKFLVSRVKRLKSDADCFPEAAELLSSLDWTRPGAWLSDTGMNYVRSLAIAYMDWAPTEELLDLIPFEDVVLTILESGSWSISTCLKYALNPDWNSASFRLVKAIAAYFPAHERTQLGFALMAVGRPDLAEVMAPHPAVFDFVIAPEPPEAILARLALPGEPHSTAINVYSLVPAEVLARLVAGATARDMFSMKINVAFAAAMRRSRSDSELRVILNAAEHAHLVPNSVEQIIRLRGLVSVSTYVKFNKRINVKGHGGDLSSTYLLSIVEYEHRCLLFAHSMAYMNAVTSGGMIRLIQGLDFMMGFYGAPEEAAEVLDSVIGLNFDLGAYRLGQESWRTMKVPEVEDRDTYSRYRRIFNDRRTQVFALRSEIEPSKVFEVAEAWAEECVRVKEGSEKDIDLMKYRFRAVSKWLAASIHKGRLPDETVIEVVVELEKFWGRYKYNPGLRAALPVRFVPKLIAAGFPIEVIARGMKSATISKKYPEPEEDPGLAYREFCISGVWADPQ
jgi:hypothetical protein